MKLDLSTKQSLCVLRLSAIGDVCHAVAMVQAIQRQYPHLTITWVIGKVEYQLVKHLPNVEFVIFDKSQGWRSYTNLKRALKGQCFDVLLHMQVALRASVASQMIKANVKVGFDKVRAKEGQWLFINHHIEPQHEPHVLDGFMGFAKAIGVVDITPKWNIPIPEADELWAQQQCQQPTFIICAAASKAERNWLPERYAQVADHMANRGYQVMLCGGPAQLELDLAQQISDHSQAQLINHVGKTSLLQLLALLKQATVVLAPDTGPAHMATTQGTPVIGLYAHSNPERTGPYNDRDKVVSVYQDVIAEQQQGEVKWGKRAKGEALMERIGVDPVLRKLTNF
ncbi:glycosyltransferase family 9 protein [Parashewanella curva]|uniref:Glycosyltransferase family 9 protein n=1 Tax=Parashewanella curva TaxID=2338552 RepID=A0A3L8PZG6_9GAMM|nr:glycosyltransferase family 9 protein [Parashewanella curva]RLV60797.1 glycosyltransferase family 9 protein [Parashewanella curva]